jgi:hypothetical protein
VQSDAINRRVAGVPGNLHPAHKPSEDAKAPVAPQVNSPASNWVIDPPNSLVEAKDFHFAVSASFRMNESMGHEFLFDEVQ